MTILSGLGEQDTEELIIGLLHEEEYFSSIIYSYDEGMVICSRSNMERPVELYEQGIVECEWGASGRVYYTYSELQKNSGLKKVLAEVSNIPGNWGGGQEEGLLYYRSTGESLEDEVEITEEEFNKVIDQYETIPVELEWNILEGFWNPEKTVS